MSVKHQVVGSTPPLLPNDKKITAMNEYQHLLVEPYQQYKQFINSCKIKQYSETEVVHVHHIIPKCLGGLDHKDNLVRLNVEDHAMAHILLSRCFEVGTDASIHNIRSANIIDSKSIRTTADLKLLAESRMGHNNPFFGKTHTSETIWQIQETKRINGTSTLGKCYDELYGDAASKEQQKRQRSAQRYWDSVSEGDREKRIHAIKESLNRVPRRTGARNKMARPVLVDGVEYDSVATACKALTTNRYFMFKTCKVEYLK